MDTVGNIVISLLVFILILGLIVFIHELGHFLAAKKVGIMVLEFAFGFGPKLFSKKYKGTIYKINLLPLGGYVKMLGDQDASSFLRYNLKENSKEDKKFSLELIKKNNIDLATNDFTIIEDFLKKQAQELKEEDYKKLQNFIFYDFIPKHKGNVDNKRKKEKLLVVSAGVIMNFILAIVLFYIFFLGNGFSTDLKKLGNPLIIGAKISSPVILTDVYSSDNSYLSPSNIISINSLPIKTKSDLIKILHDNYNKKVSIQYQKVIKDASIKTAEVVLNGDGVKSNLDEDLMDAIIIGEVQDGSLAQQIGIVQGDYLIELAGQKITDNTRISDILLQNAGQKTRISVVVASGTIKNTDFIVPQPIDGKVVFGISYGYNSPIYEDIIHLDYSEQKGLSAIYHTVNMTMYNFTGLSELIKQSIKEKNLNPVSQGLSSPVGISGIVYSLVKVEDYSNIINLAALISLSLGVMNILPIPLFDGGHILFIVLEKIRGKKISDKIQEKISMIAFYTIVALSILIIFKDIIQFDFINKIINLITSIFK